MPYRTRLLGLAFANADLLFEVDHHGLIQFAAGAANDLVKEDGGSLLGKPAAGLFAPGDRDKFVDLLNALHAGDRAGPFKLLLATGAEANLALFRLPESSARVSCTLARPGVHMPVPRADAETGLISREQFLAATEAAGSKDTLTLLNVPGLSDLIARLSTDDAQALMTRIGQTLRESGASAAGRITESSFATLSPATLGSLGLVRKLSEVISAVGLRAPKISESRLGLVGIGLSAEQRILSMRYVIDCFARKGTLEGENDISGAFERMLDDTQNRLIEMTRTVNQGDFELAFQPICYLNGRKLSHYEALARFSKNSGTADTIKFVEALGIVNALDLAVANKVLDVVQTSGADIAFNISGATISSPASFGVLATMLARRRSLAAHTLIEITETAAIADLNIAAKAVSSLRAMGYRVGLDDFGAGAASLNYLHAIPVDFVKFDGALIQKIGQSPRDDAMLAGMAKLCSELGVPTIAEWIETEEQARAAERLGFIEGQGRLLGAPCKDQPRARQINSHRQGIRESWG